MTAFARQYNRFQNRQVVSPAQPDRATPRSAHAEHPLLVQQQAWGNQAMQRLLHAGAIQAKLTVNQPGDQYEQEADRVAERVLRMPDPTSPATVSSQAHAPHVQCMCPHREEKLHRQTQAPQIQRMCPECENELHRQPRAEEDEAQALQAKEVPDRTPEVTPDVQAQVNTIRGGGQPLPESVRAFFEPRFGYDFSQMRIHTDALAAESARAVSARAYTVGQDVVFGIGQYAPNSVEGRRLLAHELTHVVQQRSVSNYSGDLSVSEPGDRAEREADVVTEAEGKGQNDQLGITSSRGPVLARQMNLEELGLAPRDFGSAEPESSVFPCNPENDEGFPVIRDGPPGTRSRRDAVGHAQKTLNFVFNELIRPCIEAQFCRATIPVTNAAVMATELGKLTDLRIKQQTKGEFPAVVDCNFGPMTEAVTKIFQAFGFDDPTEWDGIIGPNTWNRLATIRFQITEGLIPIPSRPKPPIFL
jgi:uncharacterized protein DUF4157